MKLLDQNAVPLLVVWGNSILVSTVAAPVYIPKLCTRVPFSLHPYQHLFLDLFMMAILTHVRCYLIVLLWWLVMLSVLSYALCMFSMEKCLFRSFAHFFNWIVCLPRVESCKFFMYFGDQTFVWGFICKYIFPLAGSLFILLMFSLAVQKLFILMKSHLFIFFPLCILL